MDESIISILLQYLEKHAMVIQEEQLICHSDLYSNTLLGKLIVDPSWDIIFSQLV